MTHTDNDGWRSYWYPKLHGLLSLIGLGATGRVHGNQYVCTIHTMDEHDIEHMLMDLGFVQNPLAYYKRDGHGTGSVGSWALTYENAVVNGNNPWSLPTYRSSVRDWTDNTDRQLHVTIFPRNEGFDLYAHEEYDWRDRPWAHLREKEFRPATGSLMGVWLIEEHTYLERDTDYTFELRETQP